MTRLSLLLLVALAATASAQPVAPRASAAGPVLITPASLDLPASPAAEAGPAGVSADGTLIAVVVDEPAPLEDPVQLRAAQAPVRMELAQTRRRVVLLPGVAGREPAPSSIPALEPSAELDASSARVVYSRALVVVGEGGRREVRYVDVRPSPLDLGATTGCGSGAVETGLRLRGVRATPLRLGMEGDAVRAVQQLLCVAGYDAGTDGVFDRGVDRAVRQFQQAHNESGRGRRLSVDGAFGPQTRRALEAAVAARSSR